MPSQDPGPSTPATGKTIRLRRIFDANGKAVIFAPVHNMTSMDPFPGQVDVQAASRDAAAGGVTAQVMSKGFLRACAPWWDRSVGILNYLFAYAAASPNPIRQIQISSVKESARIGADGVCVFVGLSTDDDVAVIKDLGRIGNECDKLGMAFVCEAEFPGFYEPVTDHLQTHGLRYLKFVGRLCAELGADAISTNWPGSADEFGEIVEYVKVPVLLNGGPKMPQPEFLTMLEGSVRVGGQGCLVGRNFSEGGSIAASIKAAALIVRESHSVEEALRATNAPTP